MSTDLPFPRSLPDFQRLFPDDASCAKYLEAIRFRDGFQCPHCQGRGEPGRIATRPHVLRCDGCRVFLENALTSEGYAYLYDTIRDAVERGRVGASLRTWVEFYGVSLTDFLAHIQKEIKT